MRERCVRGVLSCIAVFVACLVVVPGEAVAQMTCPTSGILPPAMPNRSLLLGGDLEQLRAMWASPVNARQAFWKSHANSRASEAFTVAAPTSFEEAVLHSSRCQAKALRWAMEPNGPNAAADIANAIAMLKNARVSGFGSEITRPELATSYLCAYDFIRGADESLLSAADRSAIESRLAGSNVMGAVTVGYLTPSNNVRGKIAATRGLAGVLLRNQSFLNDGLNRLNQHLAHTTTNDGWFCDSQSHYLNYTFPHLSTFLQAYYEGSSVSLYENFKPYITMTIGQSLPDGMIPPWSQGALCASGLHLFSRLAKNVDPQTAANIMWYLEKIPAYYDWTSYTNTLNNDWYYTRFFAMADFTVTPQPPSYSPTFFSPGGAKVTVFRHDWTPSSGYLMLSPGVDHATYSSTAHSQNDTAEIFLHTHGQTLLVPPGYHRTDLPNSPPGFDARRADWHNVVLVNGDVGTSDGGRKMRPEHFLHTNRLDATEHGGFAGVHDFASLQMTYNAATVRRNAGFPNEDYFVVADTMTRATDATYTCVLVGRGTQTVLTDSPELIKVRWVYSTAQVVEHLVSTHSMTLVTDQIWMHKTYNVYEQTRRMRASIVASNGGFISILEPGPGGSASKFDVTNLSTTNFAAARVENADAGWTDWILSQPTNALRAVDGVVSDARYAYVRETGGVRHSAMVAQGTLLATAAGTLFETSEPATLSLLFGTTSIKGTISGDNFTPGTLLRLYGLSGYMISGATIDGAPVPFSNAGSYSTVTLTTAGALVVSLEEGTANEPPEILSYWATPNNITEYQSAMLSAIAEDPEGGEVTYEWTPHDFDPAVDPVRIVGSGPSVELRSTGRVGGARDFTVEVIARDDQGAPSAPAYVVVRVRVAGDINGDDRVNMLDVAMFSVSYGSVVGDSNYDPKADFNRDGRVNVMDLAVVSTNYGR